MSRSFSALVEFDVKKQVHLIAVDDFMQERAFPFNSSASVQCQPRHLSPLSR